MLKLSEEQCASASKMEDELLAGLLSHQWSTLWPPQTHARVALLAWLSDRLQQVWRTMALCYGDLAMVYRAERALEQLCTQLQTLELKHLRKQTSDAELARLAGPVLQGSGTQLEQLTQLPPLT